MDFQLSEEQRAIQDMARSFAAAEMAPFAAGWDEDEVFPVDMLRRAAAQGLAGIYCREDHGGANLGRVEAVIVFEELAAACPSTAAYLSIQNMCAWMVDRFGTVAQRAKWLRGLTAMDLFASYCLTEPGSGSAAATAKDFEMVDAPVSGGVAGAEAATLTFMVGGAVSAFVRAEPILNCMGKTIVHTGGAGSGQAAKICNNLMLGIQMISVVEAFVLAEKLDLEAAKLFEVSSNASGQCWSLTKYCPVPGPVPESPANRDYRAGFTVEMMLKDLKLAQAAAKSEGIETRLGTAAAALYEEFAGSGKGGLDFSAIIQLVRAGG